MTIGLYHGDGIDELEQKIRMAVKELDDGDGVLGFVDILGGSPSNMVMKAWRTQRILKRSQESAWEWWYRL